MRTRRTTLAAAAAASSVFYSASCFAFVPAYIAREYAIRSISLLWNGRDDDGNVNKTLSELTDVDSDREKLLVQLLSDADILSKGNGMTELHDKYQLQTLERGFCNHVYLLESKSTAPSPSLVVKLFSDLAKVRVEEQILGSIDVVASNAEIGPRVFYRGSNGIVMSHVEGQVLTEEDVHGLSSCYGDGMELCREVAKRLCRFHNIADPSHGFEEIDNMLWHAILSMLNFIHSSASIPPALLEAGWTYEVLIREVEEMQGILKPLSLPLVKVAHGDFKPSNVIARSSTNNDAAEPVPGIDIIIIDYELSGPGYRGYDLYKFFRNSRTCGTQQLDSTDVIYAFVESYLCESMNGTIVSAELVEAVIAEMKLFEPLTWLEAGIFFLFAAKGDASTSEDIWSRLALDRFENYRMCKQTLLKKPFNEHGSFWVPREAAS